MRKSLNDKNTKIVDEGNTTLLKVPAKTGIDQTLGTLNRTNNRRLNTATRRVHQTMFASSFGKVVYSFLVLAAMSQMLTAQTAPTADFTVSTTSGNVPLTVNFTDLSTNTPTSWLWLYGDGKKDVTQSPSHTYTRTGTYNVRLVATNAFGSSDTVQVALIRVTAANSVNLLETIDLNVTPGTENTPTTRIYGDDPGDESGYSVTTGDINGDGYRDVIIGASESDPAGQNIAGETYIVYGSDNIHNSTSIDLNGTPANITRIYGDDYNDRSGHSVAAGDINGDGFDDVIIGAYGASPVGGSTAGETYIIYGSDNLHNTASIDLDGTPSNVTRIYGDDYDDRSGFSVSTGDINGDGFSDVIIGAYSAETLSRPAGETYIIYGSANLHNTASIDLDGTPSNVTRIYGDDAGDGSGGSVSTGDINGDGFDDVIIGATGGDPTGGSEAGETYIVYGADNLQNTASIDLSGTPANVTRIYGDDTDDNSGYSVCTGDINGDGYQDVIIGAVRGDPAGGSNAGETYIIYGSDNLQNTASIDLNGTPVNITRIYGDDGSDYSGRSVSAGDINGDGFDDVIIGADRADPAGGSSAGETYIIYGSDNLHNTTNIDLNGSPFNVSRIYGDDADDNSGINLSTGDINGDGVSEVIIGANFADPSGGSSAGETYIIYSGNVPPTTPGTLIAEGAAGKVNLHWNSSSDTDLAMYQIYRGTSQWFINLYDSVMATSTSDPDTFYVDTGVQNDTTYYYFVTAVDSAGQSSGNSNTVQVTPTDKIIAELLPNAATTSSGGADGGYPLNTYYEDFKYQGLYTASDLSAAGLNPGVNIVALEIYPSQSPGRDLPAFRVATAWTDQTTLTTWIATTVGYGPTYQYPYEFPMGTWVRIPINPVAWDGNSNFVVEFSDDGYSWVEGGGVYLHDAGNNRCLRGWSDSGAGSYPFDANLSIAADRFVPWLRVVYTEPAVLPPTNLTATPSYSAVTLNWTASISSNVSNYIIYRDAGTGTFTAIDTIAGSLLTYTDNSVVNGITYQYAVAAKKSTGEVSSLSGQASTTPRVAAPTNLTAGEASHQVTLSWTAATGNGVARTLIYRGLTSASLSLIDSTTDGTVTSYVDDGLTNGTTYYYALRTRGTDGSASVYTTTISATPDYFGPVWWVAASGNNTGDGSQTSPFLTIQYAIDQAGDGDTVKIKPGTYTGYGNYNLTLNGTELVVMGVGGPDSVTIDVQGSATNPRRGFYDVDNNYSDTTKIIGLKITNGFAPLSGGLWNGEGGGIMIRNGGDLTIENCVIGPGNRGLFGAGISIISLGPDSITVKNVVIKGNSNPNNPSGTYWDYHGMGLRYEGNSNSILTVESSIIRGNSGSALSGENIHLYGAGVAVYGSGPTVRLVNSLIVGNTLNQANSTYSSYGGGLYIQDNALLYVVNSNIIYNSASHQQDSWNGQGGAIWVGNNTSEVNILNSIIWGNTAEDGSSDMAYNNTGASVSVHYSDLQTTTAGDNNLFINPRFTDASNGDFTLDPASLLIGAGIGSGTTYPGQDLVPTYDLAGNIRPNPSGSNPDMGAYESALATTPYPAKPAGLSATAGDGQVTLNWPANSESDIAGYGIYYGTSTAPNTKQAEATGASTTTYIVTGLNNNIAYYFRITAIDNDGYESGFSDEVTATPQYSGTDIYVDVDSAAAGYTADGSVTRPYGSIQEAINAASDGNRILVQPGTYTGTGTAPIIDLKGKQIVLESVDGPATTIIDAGGSFGNRIALKLDAQDGFFNGYDNSTQIIGFTFTNGDDEEYLVDIQGPDFWSGSSLPWNPKFVNCRFTNTSKTSGGMINPAIYIREAAPVFDGCEFRGLSMYPSSNISIPGELRAPIILEGSNNTTDPEIYVPQFINSVIVGNSNSLPTTVANNGIIFKGGAVFIGFGMAPVFENTRLDSNTVDATSGPTDYVLSKSEGGAVYIDYYYDNSPTPVQFTNCSLSYNTVKGMETLGGGLYSDHPYIQLTNCLIVGNEVYSIYDPNNQNPSAVGGGIYAEIIPNGWGNYPGSGPTYGPTLDLINVTIAGNQVTTTTNGGWGGAGVARNSTMHFTIFNTIIAENDVIGFIDPARENMATEFNSFGSGSLDVGYALITDATEAGIAGDYLLESSPGFAGNGDYSLGISSKAIGKGGASYGTLTAPTTDYYGNSRPITSYDPGNGTYGPDLGAIENSLTVSPYPNAPENLTVTDENDSTVTLTWTAPSDNDIARYRIYSDTFSPAGSLIDSVAGVTTKTVHGLVNGTQYYFRVTAVDLDGYESDFSNEVSGTPSYGGPVWYVDDAAGSIATGKDGSPANPFGDIGDVFVNAPINAGDTILVLPGTYSDSDDRNLHVPDFPFILMSRDGPDSTIIELISASSPKYQFFTFDQETDSSTKIIGFTIQNGGGYEIGTGFNGYNNGGAMRFESGYDWGIGRFTEVSPVIRNCRFVNNTANAANGMNGGAVYIAAASPRFEQCEFVNNTAPFNGGAVYVEARDNNGTFHEAEPVFSDCLFEGNSVTDNNGNGGAISQDWQNAALTIERCRFLNNHAPNAGGAIFSSYGGGTTLPIAWTTIKNSIFAGNTTSFYGAAVVIEGQSSYVLMEHCTFTENTSTWEALKINNAFIYNSIIWNNSRDGEDLAIGGLTGDVEILNSLVENGTITPGFDQGTGLTVDPVFTDPDSGDYTLSLASFALGAGATQYYNPHLQSVVTIGGTDLAGNARIQPSGSNPDMGAYEAPWAVSPYPDAPSNLTAESLHHGARLNWNFPTAADVDRYYVYQSSDSTTWTKVDSVLGRLVTRTTISGLTNGEPYYFYITARDTENYESQPSGGIGVVPKYPGPVWYVDDDGPAFGGEGSAENPFKAISDAVRVSDDGDTILILPGLYNSSADWNINLQDVPIGNPPLPYVRNLVIIGSEGPDSTIIDLGGFGQFLEVVSGEEASISGLTVQNGSANDFSAVIKVENSQFSIDRCVFKNNTNNGSTGAVVLTGNSQSHITVTNSLFTGNIGNNSVGVFFADNIDISNSVFSQNSARLGAAFGWNPPPGATASIVNCLFLDNTSTEGGSGGAIWIQSNILTGISIYNSIFWGNSGNGSDPDVGDARNGVHNCVVQNLFSYSTDNYSFDPLIVDPDNGDFSLSEYSPAIGRGVQQYFDFSSGTYAAIPPTDFYGNLRPQPAGSLPDLGPIEHERDVQRYYVYSVATDGNDITNDGITAPFKTIQRALNEANDFDTVEVSPGTYAGTGNTQLNFLGTKAVLRSSDGPQNTIIDCENNSFGLEFSSGEGPEVLVEGFTIKRGATPEGGSAIRIPDGSPTLRNLVLANNATSGTGSAIAVDTGEPRFINCILFGNSGNGGVVFTAGNGQPTFEHCTIVNNTGNDGSGAFVVDGGSLTIHNSIVWGNTLNGDEITDIPGTSTVDVSYSLIMGDTPGTAVYNGRPALVSPMTGDFSPEDYSPAIGLADTSDFVPLDIFGNARTVSDTTAPDIGAVESPLAVPDTSGYAPLTFWVDNNGDDAGSGISPAEAFATIQRAVNFAIWSDTVKLLPGHYIQDFKTSRKDITIMGAGPLPLVRISGTAYLQGGSPTLTKLAFRGTNVALDMNNSAPDLSFLEISNNNGSPGLLILQNSAPQFDHVTVADNSGNLYSASDSSSITVKNSVIFNTGGGSDVDGTTTYNITWSLTNSSGTGNVDTDPQFRAFSYRLLARSLLVNAGDPNDQDADGTRADMGAYPYLTNHSGPDWYISELGNDTTATGSEFDPFGSVQAGLNFAQSNDTIWVAAGTYQGLSRIREADVALIGDDWETTILEGAEGGDVFTFSGSATDTVWIEDLMITGSGSGNSGLNSSGAVPVLDHVWIRGNDTGVSLNQSSAILDYCLITDNSGTGLTAIEGLPVLVNNTIANNGAGIAQSTAARSVSDSVTARNLILWNNSAGDISGNVSLTFSDFAGGTGSNIDNDPLFVDDLNGDYSLDLLSPCLDAGDSTDSFDADSTVRDMGAIPAIRTFLSGVTTDNIDVSPDTVIIVDEDLTIAPDDTLTIEPGGILYLGAGVTLFIDGELDAQGDQSGPVQFSTLYPGETFGGIRIQGGSARTIPVYRYVSISNVMSDSIPLVIDGSATLEHVTIAGNDPNVASLQVNNGSVDLNYCILESGTSGTVTNNNSYLNSTDQFVDLPNGDFNLVPDAVGIDVGVEEAAQYVDPDFTYTDAGAFYHDQSSYPVANIDILYPANGTTVLVSPDTSATTGLTTEIQLFNQYGRFKTNGQVYWNENNTNGFFGQDSTTATDLNGTITNVFTTSTTTGDVNTFVVSADGVSSEVSGTFLIEPGVPDSVWVNNQADTVMTQLDTLGFSAWIYDQFENLVRDGETVNWSVVPVTGNGNGFVLSAPQSTTLAGLGSIDLMTDPNTALQVGDQVRIQAESNGAVHQSGTITVVPDDIFSLTMPSSLTDNPIDLSADVASILLSATLVDTFDNPLEGVAVNWAVVTGAGTGENLSAGVTTTDADGYTEVTLTTGTVSGLQYRVETWITQTALLTALRNGSGPVTTPESAEQPGSKGNSSAVKAPGTGRSISGVRLAVKGKTLRSAGIGEESGNGYSTESIFGLRDTTAVITVVPGVTATVTLPTDSVDVVRQQTLDIPLTAVDQFGNHVADGTTVGWEILPATSNVTVIGSDDVTTDGSAVIHLAIDSLAVWEFDFHVQATVEGITGLSGTYNVDDQIAPAAPLTLAITPNVWTSTNSFDLAWTNPVEHSGIAGVHYQVDSETEVYVAGNDIAALTGIVLPQNGISTITLWLEDLAGNTENTNAAAIIAKWDDTAPDAFNLISPLAGWYNNNTPELKWNASADVTAGLRNYRLNLDGSPTEFDPAVVSYQIATALSEGSHSWSVFAVDSAGNETEASNPQTIQVDVTAPSIAHNPVLEGNANSPVTITASFSDARSGINRAELYYRKGGELTWQPAVDMKTLSTYQIASSFVTSVGVEYYLETEDVAGNITRKPETGFYSISVTVGGTGIASADRWPTGIANGTGVSDYQLISFPMQAANNTPTDILVDDLGNYDKTKWRFFTYEAGTWLEFADITSIDPGQSYFLIVKDPGLSINTGQVRSVDTDQSFTINLTAGDWTFIGNPFNFDISLDMVTVQDTVSLAGDPNLYTWDADWVAPTKLKPWNGYIYKSAQGGQLKINPRNATGRMLPKSLVLDQPLDENEWLVTITATNGVLHDRNNQVGVLNSAQDEFDRLDAFEPPVLPGNMALRIDDREWAEAGDVYRRDIRTPNEDGRYWDLEVLSGDPESSVEVQFAGLNDIPEDFEIFVVDLTLKTAQNLRWDSNLRFASSSTGLVHRLRFIAGTREFAEANSGGVSLVPDAYTVSQNFPNPFNPQTTINLGLEEGAQIHLAIYNILGQEVTVLANNEFRPAGYYSFIWRGRNNSGQRVASGVYFYITEVTSPTGVSLLRDTRKMILVK